MGNQPRHNPAAKLHVMTVTPSTAYGVPGAHGELALLHVVEAPMAYKLDQESSSNMF